MRLWSLHPRYLDPQGLVALWREGLLAQAVLLGRTRGYRMHPQLDRFKESADPVRSIAAYLREVAVEAGRRGYRFDASKIAAKPPKAGRAMRLTRGQLRLERAHLQAKLDRRAPDLGKVLRRVRGVEAHPMFLVVQGGIAHWERPAKGSGKGGGKGSGKGSGKGGGKGGGKGNGKGSRGASRAGSGKAGSGKTATGMAVIKSRSA